MRNSITAIKRLDRLFDARGLPVVNVADDIGGAFFSAQVSRHLSSFSAANKPVRSGKPAL
jgi:hypothetical protein